MKKTSILLALLFIVFSCKQPYTPKPNGYMRIDLPVKRYVPYKSNLPYSFEIPDYGIVEPDHDRNAEPYWVNIDFPKYKCKIHISYKIINNNLGAFIEDTRKLAYKHSPKADAIDELVIKNDSNNVFGILYDIKGNTASSVQFFLTDSVKNFLRGALYISSEPNKDSLAPEIKFFRKDVDHFINTLKWRNK
jgi:gliding motility-associated lipoprotein GldD